MFFEYCLGCCDYSIVHLSGESLNSDEEEEDHDLFVNPNRPPPLSVESSSSDSEVED